MALLHMLKALSRPFNLHLVAAHLNHCLRPEAAYEEAEVKKIAAAWSLPCETRASDIRSIKRARGISEEEAGRLARYSLLFDTARKYGAFRIALGHHLDDQAETVLLNILRGTGVDGLAGILPVSKRGRFSLIRPLLCLRRREIEAYCKENDLRPFTDSSNLETEYTRNKLRLELIPRLEQDYNPRIREALINLAALAAEDRRFLQAMARKKYLDLAGFGRRETIFNKNELAALPRALSARVLRMAHKKYAPSRELDSSHIQKVLELAESGKTTGQISLPGEALLFLSQDRIIMAGASAAEDSAQLDKPLQVPGKTRLPDGALIEARFVDPGDLAWPPSKFQAYLDFDRLPPGALRVRSRWPGARFHPHGSPGAKKLKDFLIDHKVPQHWRSKIPLVSIGDEIVWVAGFRIAHPYRVTDRTGRVLVLAYKKLMMPKQRNIC